jgi:integrase
MATGQIDQSCDLWFYAPARHKTEDLGRDRTVAMGQRAREVLKPWLKADPAAPLFSPIEAMEQEYASRGGGLKRARKPKENPKRQPRKWHDSSTYKTAVARAFDRAGVPIFRPTRIRYPYATRVRKGFGLDVAQVMLGHAKADVTLSACSSPRTTTHRSASRWPSRWTRADGRSGG